MKTAPKPKVIKEKKIKPEKKVTERVKRADSGVFRVRFHKVDELKKPI